MAGSVTAPTSKFWLVTDHSTCPIIGLDQCPKMAWYSFPQKWSKFWSVTESFGTVTRWRKLLSDSDAKKYLGSSLIMPSSCSTSMVNTALSCKDNTQRLYSKRFCLSMTMIKMTNHKMTRCGAWNPGCLVFFSIASTDGYGSKLFTPTTIVRILQYWVHPRHREWMTPILTT